MTIRPEVLQQERRVYDLAVGNLFELNDPSLPGRLDALDLALQDVDMAGAILLGARMDALELCLQGDFVITFNNALNA